MQVIKAKRAAEEAERKPALARAEIVDKSTRGRFEAELDAALKRRPPGEAKLTGALRAVAPYSQGLRALLGDAVQMMIKRGARDRELYAGALRTLAESNDRRLPAVLKLALATEDAGGAPALSAACFTRDPSLTQPLAKIAGTRQSHVAFGAELARVARGESNGAHLAALAPRIKESHRIAMCVDLFAPLLRGAPVPAHVGPALTVLRGAERHLGRWLLLAEVAVKAGDRTPIEEARAKADVGPQSARAAWALVSWALLQTEANTRRAAAPHSAALAAVASPTTRPTLELIARLSDRPSADRDPTFLFRMAHAGAPVTRAMLEAFGKQLLGPDETASIDETAVRAALYLAKDHAREDMKSALAVVAATAKREELRGLAAAALWDAGARERAREIADDLVISKSIGNVAWGALIRAAARLAPSLHEKKRAADVTNGAGAAPAAAGAATNGGAAHAVAAHAAPGATAEGVLEPLVTETPYRWIQWGWLE